MGQWAAHPLERLLELLQLLDRHLRDVHLSFLGLPATALSVSLDPTSKAGPTTHQHHTTCHNQVQPNIAPLTIFLDWTIVGYWAPRIFSTEPPLLTKVRMTPIRPL